MYNNCKYFIVNPQILRCRYSLADEYIGHGVEFTFLRASLVHILKFLKVFTL